MPHLKKSCGKNQYKSLSIAKKSALDIFEKNQLKLKPYHCEKCGMFHLTKHYQTNRKAIDKKIKKNNLDKIYSKIKYPSKILIINNNKNAVLKINLALSLEYQK